MRVLITAGPTHEPIDPVRYLGNRSSGQMGKALTDAAIRARHEVTVILGPVTLAFPPEARQIHVRTSREMLDAVATEFPKHDLLLMAAAVSDYRPKQLHRTKLERSHAFTLELEPTDDILATVGSHKRPDQRTVGFSLVDKSDIARSLEKLRRKNLDLIVSNPLETMASDSIEAILLWPDGRREELSSRTKAVFADNLLERVGDLFK